MTNQLVDAKDLLILFHLQRNSRTSLSDLGKKLELTPAAITYRLNKLIENDVITSFTIKVNHELLTPSFQSYLLQGKVQGNLNLEVQEKLIETTFFERILEVAAYHGLIGLTHPLSNKNLKELTKVLKNIKMDDYQLIPITNEKITEKSQLTGENIANVYCPLCQKSITGQGIVSQIENQTLSFCCRECLREFEENYSKLLKDQE